MSSPEMPRSLDPIAWAIYGKDWRERCEQARETIVLMSEAALSQQQEIARLRAICHALVLADRDGDSELMMDTISMAREHMKAVDHDA